MFLRQFINDGVLNYELFILLKSQYKVQEIDNLYLINVWDFEVDVRTKAYKLSRRVRHRGPDKSKIIVLEISPDLYHVISHEKLGLVDLSDKGRQPFRLVDDENIIHMQKGELYDYWKARPELKKKHQFSSNSDTEIVGMLYKEYGTGMFWNYLNRMFATVVIEMNKKSFSDNSFILWIQ